MWEENRGASFSGTRRTGVDRTQRMQRKTKSTDNLYHLRKMFVKIWEEVKATMRAIQVKLSALCNDRH